VKQLKNTQCQEWHEVEDEIIDQDQPKKIKNKFVLSDEQNQEINKLITDEARKVREKLGPFKFGDQTFSNLEQRPWHTDEEGTKYLGEWNPKIRIIYI
jgi:hypothetical protein